MLVIANLGLVPIFTCEVAEIDNTLWPKVIWSKNLATTKQPAYYEILYKINVGGEAKAAACAQ